MTGAPGSPLLVLPTTPSRVSPQQRRALGYVNVPASFSGDATEAMNRLLDHPAQAVVSTGSGADRRHPDEGRRTTSGEGPVTWS